MMLSSFHLYACYIFTLVFIIVRFSASTLLGGYDFQCDTNHNRTFTTTTAYYGEREQLLKICHGRATNETVNKPKLHIFEVEETVYGSNELAQAGGVGVMTALVRTNYLSSNITIVFITATHAVNLDVFLEGDGGLSKVYLITSDRTKSSVSVTSITASPQIIQLDCNHISKHSTSLTYSTTSRCEKEHIYNYFNANLGTVTTVTKAELVDEWIIDLR